MEYKNTEKICAICQHYVQYYYKHRTKFNDVHCGHCRKSKSKSKIKYPKETCALWEVTAKKAEQATSIEIILKIMAKRIEDIAILLKMDAGD